MPARYLAFCASVPKRWSMSAMPLCTCRMVANPASAAANSSMHRQYSGNDMPAPPDSSGMCMPRKPSSATAFSSACGQAPVRSRSAAVAPTTSCATLRAASRIMISCSLRNAADVSLMVFLLNRVG
ncbi:hypothetical protein D9M71_730360 [compost metagenome]